MRIYYSIRIKILRFISDLLRPRWKDAPEWANWLSMDEDSWWHWTESEPDDDYGSWSSFRLEDQDDKVDHDSPEYINSFSIPGLKKEKFIKMRDDVTSRPKEMTCNRQWNPHVYRDWRKMKFKRPSKNKFHVFTPEDREAWAKVCREWEEAGRTADLTFSETDPTQAQAKGFMLPSGKLIGVSHGMR